MQKKFRPLEFACSDAKLKEMAHTTLEERVALLIKMYIATKLKVFDLVR